MDGMFKEEEEGMETSETVEMPPERCESRREDQRDATIPGVDWSGLRKESKIASKKQRDMGKEKQWQGAVMYCLIECVHVLTHSSLPTHLERRAFK